ncbi:hypothetical protein ELY33_01560 [Vreelandella andesensis]|uniref:Uncharacterized protein n=1 Tax=Vreelandella andesensis TaxID=447567 RepID=A0A3S0WNN6_9GAMM|nr:hypothetical protein [Halomonas andesensis]RUR33949.1 hypothetical protein ELY33_01560 [Halomonas andesensis]
MLFEDSMSLLWLSYYALSLFALVAVYFALAFLPRLLRLLISWCVAGAMWMPASYRLPLIEEGEFYTGWAPAAMVSAVALLESNVSALSGGLLWLILGVALGACIGLALWWWRRPEPYETVNQHQSEEEDAQPARRREPVIN